MSQVPGETPEQERIRWYRAHSGIHACMRYYDPSGKPAKAAALAELLMWWEAIDAERDKYPTYVPAMEAEGLWPTRTALRYARNRALHQALILETSAGFVHHRPADPFETVWEPLNEPEQRPIWEKERQIYQALLAGKPIDPTVQALDRVFHAVFGAEPPQWLQAGAPGSTKPE